MNIHMTYTNLDHGRAAILRPCGTLDWLSYQSLIAQAWVARDADVRYLIVDLSDVERVGVAGLVGLYAVARLAQGAPPPDSEAGWAAVRALVEDQPLERPLAVVNPRPPVRQALANTPYCDFLALHADLAEALAALAA
jgi:hypothetical protein